jgi:hypothetical protein
MGFSGRRRYIIWSRFLGTTNRFDIFPQIDATPEIKFENEDDDDEDDYDTRRAVATRYTTARRV